MQKKPLWEMHQPWNIINRKRREASKALPLA
uniref:Putative disease resistance protein RGA4 n=1 Tax=Rhizophora mucronata TaxID=61149 RepID=A0A2P2MWU3_RHIMU